MKFVHTSPHFLRTRKLFCLLKRRATLVTANASSWQYECRKSWFRSCVLDQTSFIPSFATILSEFTPQQTGIHPNTLSGHSHWQWLEVNALECLDLMGQEKPVVSTWCATSPEIYVLSLVPSLCVDKLFLYQCSEAYVCSTFFGCRW